MFESVLDQHAVLDLFSAIFGWTPVYKSFGDLTFLSLLTYDV